MLYYKNNSVSTKTFYGVEFKPGETKCVPGYITHHGMIRVDNANVSSTRSPVEVNPAKPARARKKRRLAVSEPMPVAEPTPMTEIETSNTQIDLINNIEEELDNGSN